MKNEQNFAEQELAHLPEAIQFAKSKGKRVSEDLVALVNGSLTLLLTEDRGRTQIFGSSVGTIVFWRSSKIERLRGQAEKLLDNWRRKEG